MAFDNVEKNSERPEVRTLVCVLAVILFRRHVGKSSDEHSGQSLGRFHHPRDAKIYDLNCAFLAEHHIGRLDIAMDDSAPVRVI